MSQKLSSPGRGSASNASPSDGAEARGSWRSPLLAAIIAVVGVVFAVLVDRGTFKEGHRFSPGPGGASVEIKSQGIKFRNLDAATKMSDATIGHIRTIVLGKDEVDAGLGSIVFQVTGQPRQWVFAWLDSVQSDGLHGLPLDSEVSPAIILPGREIAEHATDTRSPADRQKALEKSLILTYGEAALGDPPPKVANYVDAFSKQSWKHTLTFAVPQDSPPVYLALVDHPIDGATTARVMSFLDNALARPRTLHHATGIMTLMLACGGPPPVKWLEWLETVATRSIGAHVSESDPIQIAIVNQHLRSRARQVRIEAAAALAVLSDFKRVGPLLGNLKAEPQQTVATFIEFCKARSIDTSAAPRFQDVLALIPEADRPAFELALLHAKPDALVAATLAKWADGTTPAAIRIDYGIAAISVVVSQGNQHPQTQQLAREGAKALGMAKRVSNEQMMDMAIALSGLGKPALLSALLTRAQNNNYQPADPWEQGWWAVIESDSEIRDPYITSQLDQLIGVAYSPGLSGTLRPKLRAIVERYADPEGDDPEDLKMLFHQTQEAITTEPGKVYDTLLKLCVSKNPRDLDRLGVMLDAGWNPNRVFPREEKSLLYTASGFHGSVEGIKLLVSRGADVNQRAPLEHAMESGSLEAVKTLLDAGAKFSQGSKPTPEQLVPWMMMAGKSSLAKVKLLIEHGADIKLTAPTDRDDGRPVTLMDVALRVRNSEVIAFCRQHGIKASAQYNDLRNELQTAIQSNDLDEIDRIVSVGFDLNVELEYKSRLLLFSLSPMVKMTTLERLFHHGIRVDVHIYHHAQSLNRPEINELLQKESAKASKDAMSDPVQVYLAAASDLPTLKKMLDAGLDPNKPLDLRKHSAFQIALITANESAIELLLQHGGRAQRNDPRGLPDDDALRYIGDRKLREKIQALIRKYQK